MATGDAEKYLDALVAGLHQIVNEKDDVSTQDFVAQIECVIRVFDYLGSVLGFAKTDMHAKNESLRGAAEQLPRLRLVVDADKAAGTVTVKNSKARNLHRLTTVIKFTRLLFTHMLNDAAMTLKDAAWKAYEASLAPIHPWAVKQAVWAGLYMLPTRAQFLTNIGETEDSARPKVTQFTTDAEVVETAILALYEGTQMPASDGKPIEKGAGDGAASSGGGIRGFFSRKG